MGADLIQRVIEGSWPDPETGDPVRVPTRAVVIAPSLAGREARLVGELDLPPPYAVVSDSSTQAVMGARVAAALGGLGATTAVVLPAAPHADDATAARLRATTASARTLIAVGSGTINDLCKYAAALDGKRCATFATAPSMNGFTSMNAAITVEGHKKSLPAIAPEGVFIDLAVLAAAPRRLIRAGLGDSVARSTAQADWLLAHLLTGVGYRAAPFALLAEDEDELFAVSAALVSGDVDAMRHLARTLVLSGFGMTLCGSSHPASEGEHLIGHVIEMIAPPDTPASFHGETIGVTTLTMARLQELMLGGRAPRLGATAATEADAQRFFGPELGAECWKAFQPKRLDAARAAALNASLAANWDAWRERLKTVTRPARQIEDVLRRAGAPTRPEDLGLSRAFYAGCVLHARLARDRFTFLDLAADSGVLADFVRDGA